MINPWIEIELYDYEKHMSSDSVRQLQVINEMMKEQLDAFPVHSVMICGIAGGNGLEHIDKQRIDKVYDADINASCLYACTARYPHLQSVLETIQADLTQD